METVAVLPLQQAVTAVGAGAGEGARRKRWATKVRTGCSTCRKRRVKCDETKPLCNRCTSTGRECVGYNFGLDAAASQLSRAQAHLPAHLYKLQVLARQPAPPPQARAPVDVMDIMYLVPILAEDANTVKLGAKIIESVHFPGRELKEYAQHLPARMGHSALLDTAVRCVAHVFREFYCRHTTSNYVPNPAKQMETTFLYTKALAGLQKALNSPKDSLKPETLCATELLYMFECFRGETIQVTRNHADGASRLIQHRGPRRFTSEFAKSLLLSRVPMLVLYSIFSNTKTFVTDDAWVDIIRSTIPNGPPGSDPEIPFRTFYAYALPIFGLQIGCNTLIMSQNLQPAETILAERKDLLHELSARRPTFWRVYQQQLADQPTAAQGYNEWHCGKWEDILGMYRGVWLVSSRLYVALGGRDRAEVERHSQSMASELLDAHFKADMNPMRRANNILIVKICKSVLDTAEEWSEISQRAMPKNGLPEMPSPEVLGRWAGLAGIHIPPVAKK